MQRVEAARGFRLRAVFKGLRRREHANTAEHGGARVQLSSCTERCLTDALKVLRRLLHLRRSHGRSEAPSRNEHCEQAADQKPPGCVSMRRKGHVAGCERAITRAAQ